MKRLRMFQRIFLWFLGAMILMAGVSVLLTVFMTRQGIILTGQQEILSGALQRNGNRLLGIIESEDPSRLEGEIDKIRKDTGLLIFIFDEYGSPIQVEDGARREFLERLGKDALSLLSQGTTFQVRWDFSSVYSRMVSPSGRSYVLVGSLRSSPYIAKVLTGNRKVLLIHLAGLLAVALFFCFILARYLSYPLVRLSRTAISVSDGDLDAPVDALIKRRSDEIGELARSFDAMTRHLTTLLEAQRRLIQDISHELRTPLARLCVALGLARKKTGTSASESLDRIEREAEVLNDMIGDLLSLSRFESEMEHTSFEKADLLAILDNVVEDANFEAKAVNKSVILTCPESLEAIKMNPEMIRRAVENIVRNAVRYTPEGTSVSIVVEPGSGQDNKGVAVRVSDHGPGVPEEELELIFKPFYRTEASRSRDTGGSGLGLAIAHKAVLAHGGSIHAGLTSGGGLFVEIWLPA